MHSSCRVSNLSTMLKFYRCLLENVQTKLWNNVNQIDVPELGFAEQWSGEKISHFNFFIYIIGKEVWEKVREEEVRRKREWRRQKKRWRQSRRRDNIGFQDTNDRVTRMMGPWLAGIECSVAPWDLAVYSADAPASLHPQTEPTLLLLGS